MVSKGLNKKRIKRILEILINRFKTYKKPTVRRTSKKHDAFKTLISCLLSLRTLDETTDRVSSSLFKIAGTPKEILNIPIKKLERIIYSSGYYKNKARIIKSVSKTILEKYNGVVPKTKKELMSIKGIGPKTANIVLGFAYKKDVIAVDTHVHRISNRLGWVKTKIAEQTEKELMKVVPKRYWREINTTFILFGKNICKPRFPRCTICPINNLCPKISVLKKR